MDMTSCVSWILIVVGALVFFLAKPIIAKDSQEADTEKQTKKDKILYITKIIGMWLIIIGAALIFISGGMYGRH